VFRSLTLLPKHVRKFDESHLTKEALMSIIAHLTSILFILFSFQSYGKEPNYTPFSVLLYSHQIKCESEIVPDSAPDLDNVYLQIRFESRCELLNTTQWSEISWSRYYQENHDPCQELLTRLNNSYGFDNNQIRWPGEASTYQKPFLRMTKPSKIGTGFILSDDIDENQIPSGELDCR
jgi:hypothetical protein